MRGRRTRRAGSTASCRITSARSILNRLSLEVATALEVPDTEIQSNARLNLGDSLAALGRADEAEEHFLAVEQVVRQPRPPDHWMLWRYAQHLFHSYGELWLARGETERALAYAERVPRPGRAQ